MYLSSLTRVHVIENTRWVPICNNDDVISECIPKYCARGLFNRKLCKCMCPKGFWGQNCSSKL